MSAMPIGARGDEPAFPVPTAFSPISGEPSNTGQYWDGNGMSKRELYAGMAMQALISDFHVGRAICDNDPRYKKQADGQYNFSEVIAINACEFADALLKELEK
jgi:hypothetical protein